MCVVRGFVLVLAAVRGQSSRRNRSQQMSLYAFLPLLLPFTHFCSYVGGAQKQTETALNKTRKRSQPGSVPRHSNDSLLFLRPWRYVVVAVSLAPTPTWQFDSILVLLLILPCDGPSESWVCMLTASVSFQLRCLGISHSTM